LEALLYIIKTTLQCRLSIVLMNEYNPIHVRDAIIRFVIPTSVGNWVSEKRVCRCQ